ncbi:ethanolamine ammonia-lyase subunit EutC [Methylomonas sp. SURF-2]|uniref:Ethanolamine ammonia-lyase small subunit n=1 Tax=Methylomonas subterranea TaxID=2952225 RepID=A0ABT1TDI9_9GAMM|nr:ethanolamine ammonia-lyase subunit EutC [Methylomonas sp. SURF-2]MCQ8103522.1 ethanolamine ammonia-lyase subunit EutC [Methylomonas sp. SURF-2]
MAPRDPWFELRRYTQARIGQGRAGCATPTQPQLEFQLAHAMARDAVHQAWSVEHFAQVLAAKTWQSLALATPILNRRHYLQRPDLGRILAPASRDTLQALEVPAPDVALVVSNGLSSTAVETHGLPLLAAVIEAYAECALSISPICLVANARVAVADEIGALLGAKASVIIVGERPGLSAADSLGIYLTHAPQPGRTDAERNCLSNIRPPAGMSYTAAAAKLAYLTRQALQRQLSGVALKDDMREGAVPSDGEPMLNAR